MMDDTIELTVDNGVLGCYDSARSQALLRIEDIQDYLGETLWIFKVDPDRSFRPDTELFSTATIAVPPVVGDISRAKLRALRKRLVDAGAATLDWGGVEQELRERRGDIED